MRNELTIKVGKDDIKVFLQQGFYYSYLPSSQFHKHLYAEIHVISNGTAELYVDGKKYHIQSGDILVIPPGKIHKFMEFVEFSDQAFQVDMKLTEFDIINFPLNILKLFSSEIRKSINTDNYVKVNAHLTLICSYFADEIREEKKEEMNYGFQIYEFFANNYYNNVSISDLAETLHLSEKQTERLVVKYTGKTFKQELIDRRMEMAEHIMKTQQLSQSEIASLVGYNSYSGFWKAKQKNEK